MRHLTLGEVVELLGVYFSPLAGPLASATSGCSNRPWRNPAPPGYEVHASVDDQERLMPAVASGALDREQLASWLSQHIVKIP
jgi:hypothetical protein